MNNKKTLFFIFFSYILSFLCILVLFAYVHTYNQAKRLGSRRAAANSLNLKFKKRLFTHPSEIKTDGESLFILNNAFGQILKIDSNGQVKQTYLYKPDSVSKKPLLISYHPTVKNIVIIDERQKVFLELSPDFKVQNKFKLNIAVNRIGYLDSNRIITTKLKILNKSALTEFSLINADGKEKELNSILPKVENNGVIYDGFFLSSVKSIYYINYFYNNISCLDFSGKAKYQVKSVDNVAIPKVKIAENGWITYANDSQPVNLGGTIDNSHIYILTNTQVKSNSTSSDIGSFIDLYSEINGKYLESFIIPNYNDEAPIGICSLKNKMYAIYSDQLVCFEIKKV